MLNTDTQRKYIAAIPFFAGCDETNYDLRNYDDVDLFSEDTTEEDRQEIWDSFNFSNRNLLFYSRSSFKIIKKKSMQMYMNI